MDSLSPGKFPVSPPSNLTISSLPVFWGPSRSLVVSWVSFSLSLSSFLLFSLVLYPQKLTAFIIPVSSVDEP